MSAPRRRRLLLAAANLALLALLLSSGRGIARAATDLRHAEESARTSRAERRNVGIGEIQAIALDGSRRPLAAGEGPALALVFDTACGPCGSNMWNWTDLVRDLPPDVRIVALTVTPAAGAAEYWGALGRRVEVLAVDTTVMRDRLRVTSTPTTLVIRGRRLVREYVGPLNRLARDELFAELGRAPGARPLAGR